MKGTSGDSVLKQQLSILRKPIANRNDQDLALLAASFKDSPFFLQLSTETATEMCKAMYLRRYQEGQTIFEEGDSGDEFFTILAGRVSVSVLASGDQEPNSPAAPLSNPNLQAGGKVKGDSNMPRKTLAKKIELRAEPSPEGGATKQQAGSIDESMLPPEVKERRQVRRVVRFIGLESPEQAEKGGWMKSFKKQGEHALPQKSKGYSLQQRDWPLISHASILAQAKEDDEEANSRRHDSAVEEDASAEPPSPSSLRSSLGQGRQSVDGRAMIASPPSTPAQGKSPRSKRLAMSLGNIQEAPGVQEEEEQEEQAEESDDAEARDQEEHSQDTAKYGQPLKRDQEKQEEQEEEKDEGESAAKAHDQDVNSEKMQALILAGLCEEEILKVQLEEFQRKVSGDSDQSLFSGRRLPMSSRRNSNREGRPLCARKFGTGNRNSTEGDEVKAVDVVRDVQHDATDAIYLDDRIEGDSAKDSLLHEVRPDYFVEHGQVATMVETLTLPAGRSDMSLKQSRALSAAKNSKACASLVPALTVSVGRTCGSSHHLCVQDVPSARMQRRSMSPGPAAPSSFQGTHSSLLSMGGSIVPDDRPDDSLDSERSFVNSLRQARSPALPAGSALAVARRCVSKPKKAAGGAHSFGRDRPRWRILPPKIAHRRGNAAFQLPSALVVAEPDRRPLSARVG
eukprot:TRINITY_DN5760_c0_g1_i1.p1 TRINITY_DN5760_c0_g1~~TRINITY_DN5760_c0_g1_i1.p1  ORF type:complete len:681 (+),score=163.72 TRINITY_DN5760_c0_g1_i1:83-2125(+)